jgi:hypothetical protein
MKLMKEDMKFEGTDAPNPDDPAQMTAMRSKRDPEAYKQWRAYVEPKIHKRLAPWSPLR